MTAFPHPFYFLRHGETTWNAAHRTQGQLNSTLSDLGRDQARIAGEALKNEPIQRIIASPLNRAYHTAQATAAHHGIEVEVDRDLMECHLGVHQGKPHSDFLPAYFRGEHDPEQGETFHAFTERVWAAMSRAVQRGPGTLIVAHGGLWIAARTKVTVAPDLARMPNALPLAVTPADGHWDHRIVGGVVPDQPGIAY